MVSTVPVRVAIDIETTGLQVESDSIIEIGAARFQGETILETLETFVEPRQALPYRIQRLTNITPEMLAGAPAFGTIAGKLREFIGDLPLVGHSVGFDAAFLRKQRLAERNGLLDTFELASLLLPDLGSYSLERVADFLGCVTPAHHRALADAILARDVLLALEARIQALPDDVLQDLCDLVSPLVLRSAALLHQERQRRGLSAGSGRATIGQALTAQIRMDPAVLGMRVAALDDPAPQMVAPVAPAAPPPRDDRVAALVESAFTNATTCIAELSPKNTGIHAVLIPALRWALARDATLCIVADSTHAARDLIATHLPQALGAIAPDAAPLPVALLTEPRDALCLHRWFGPGRRDIARDPEALRGVAKLTIWVRQTETGIRTDVTLGPTESPAWEAVRAGREFIGMPGCAYREKGWCFAHRAQLAAEAARVVVTTHAAFLGEASVTGDAILVLDAQRLEEHALEHATVSLDHKGMQDALHWLWHTGAHGVTGVLVQAARAIPGDAGQPWGNQVTRAGEAAQAFFQALTGLAPEPSSKAKPPSGEQGPNAIRLGEAAHAFPGWGSVQEAWAILEKRLRTVSESAAKALQTVQSMRGQEALAMELQARRDALQQLVTTGRECLQAPRDDMVYWARPPQFFQRGRQGQPMGERDTMASLHGAPLHAGAIVRAALRRGTGGVVLAGTALTVEGTFSMISDQLGLPTGATSNIMPVDYSAQTLVLIPNDAPEPNMNTYQRVLGDALTEAVTALGGQTVVLFASHTALRATANALRPALEQAGILLLAQGIDGSLKHLWQNYRAQDRIVLFGAGGMWEGWESDGARPRCLFIPRLPLPALGDPVVAARASRSGDPVRHFTVPIAAQRLRQALNQLAWRHDERNVIVLYDSRLVTREYGETILHTLPPVTMRQVSVASMSSAALEWLGM